MFPDFRNRGLLSPRETEAYILHSITGFGRRIILARTAVDPKSLLADVQREIWAVDSNAAVVQSRSIQDLLAAEAYTRPQFGLITVGAFAGIGLALVLIGIFSVMAYTVALQTHEIGVRIALGAQHGNVLKMVLWKGLRLVSAGILIGRVALAQLRAFLHAQSTGRSLTDTFTSFAA